jgi:hypothetical protein
MNKVIRSLLFVFVFLAGGFHSVYAGGTTGKISGKVLDKNNRDGLPSAIVVIVGQWSRGQETKIQGSLGASTNVDGEYYILNIPPGEYSVEARMVGYRTGVKQRVLVNIDRTTQLDIELSSDAVKLQEMVVVANNDRIRKDIAYSAKGISVEEMSSVPQLRFKDMLTNEVGIEQDAYGVTIRGGTEKEVAFNIDGVSLSDSRTNRPYTNINTELIQEVQLITGGFNAEYSNARSGLVNVVTKRSPDRYTGSVKMRYRVPNLKHFGPNMWTKDNWWDFGRFQHFSAIEGPRYRNELGDTVKAWHNEKGENIDRDRDGVPDFQGWNSYAASGLNQYKLTPDDNFKLWKYQHRNDEFAKELGVDPVLHYGDTPDYDIQTSFGGPLLPFKGVPILSDIDFFGGYSKRFTAYTFQLSRDGFSEENGQVKLNYRAGPNTTMSLFGMYGETHACGWFLGEDHSYANNPGYIIQNIYGIWALQGMANVYAVDNNSNWIDWKRYNYSFAVNHFINPSTFFDIRVQATLANYDASPPQFASTTSTVDKLGNTRKQYASNFSLINTANDTINFPTFPRGYDYYRWPEISGGYTTDQNGYYLHNLLDSWGYDSSSLATYTIQGDYTSQLNSHHQLKFGVLLNSNHVVENRWAAYPRIRDLDGELIGYSGTHFNVRFLDGGTYLQDKIEYASFVVNAGVRFDFYHVDGNQLDIMAHPNRPDLYGSFMRDVFMDSLASISTTVPLKWSISPRFGIAHPIGEDSKLYFNYGQFTQIPTTNNLYWLRYGNIGGGGRLEFTGNALLPLPKTTSYEIGFEQSIRDVCQMTLSGYYKDARNQPQFVMYNNGNPETLWFSYMDYAYWTQKGFEVQVFRRSDSFFNGFINFSWFLNTYGTTGPTLIRPDDIDTQNKNVAAQARSLSKQTFDPILKTKAGISFATPKEFGPKIFGAYPLENMRLGGVVKWREGIKFHWDPTGQTDQSDRSFKWQDYWMVDVKLEKAIEVFGADMSFSCDVYNVFNIRNFNVTDFGEAIYEGTDYYQSPGNASYTFAAFGKDAKDEFDRYMKRITQTGKTPGAQVEEAYMPKRSYLVYLFPRDIWFSVRVGF